MNLPRRTFLKTSLAATASAALASKLTSAPAAESVREYYELRAYRLLAGTRLKADANSGLLDGYLEHAFLPALDQLGVKNVGVFTEVDINKETATATPKSGSPVWVLIPHRTLESFVQVSATLNTDATVQKTGADYLNAPKAAPAFERIDSWLLQAFAGLPKMEVPAFSRNRTPTRIFEMRDYESHSELKALSKMGMFNDGEIALMKDLGMSPLFYGEALAGPDLPHLRYITGAADLATHLANWKKFGPDPRWTAMKDLPQYADNTSKNTSRFVVPKPYSEI